MIFVYENDHLEYPDNSDIDVFIDTISCWILFAGIYGYRRVFTIATWVSIAEVELMSLLTIF